METNPHITDYERCAELTPAEKINPDVVSFTDACARLFSSVRTKIETALTEVGLAAEKLIAKGFLREKIFAVLEATFEIANRVNLVLVDYRPQARLIIDGVLATATAIPATLSEI